jgi:methionyl-tRNA formyltransferase
MKIALLAGNTARSQAYSQALQACGFSINQVIYFGASLEERRPDVSCETERLVQFRDELGIFIPDLKMGVLDTSHLAGWKVDRVLQGDVNHPEVVGRVIAAAPDLILYSGYGGQIVGRNLLSLNIPILHVHSGWLPEFRGSTTLYYHLLKEDYCGVSAIYLREKIDTGPVLLRKKYPKPPVGMDIDYLYDGAIRADLLIEVLQQLNAEGGLSEISEQDSGKAKTYYVIHPVLKHFAFLSRKGA